MQCLFLNPANTVFCSNNEKDHSALAVLRHHIFPLRGTRKMNVTASRMPFFAQTLDKREKVDYNKQNKFSGRVWYDAELSHRRIFLLLYLRDGLRHYTDEMKPRGF